MDWTLERVNDPRSVITLKKTKDTYYCGRNPCNDIICPSLVVSRKHCVFIRTGDDMTVIDFGSSNGIYVNGRIQEPKVVIKLHDNDIIGIGSLDTYRDNEPMYVYKLCKGNRNSPILEEFDDLLTQRSSESEIQVVPQTEATNFVSSVEENARSARKRNLSIANNIELDSASGAKKIPKRSNKHQIIQDNNPDVSEVKASIVLADVSAKQEDDSPEVEEIQEVFSTIKTVHEPKQKIDPPKPKLPEPPNLKIDPQKPKINHPKPKMNPPKPKMNNPARPITPVVETNGVDIDRSNRMTLNLKSNESQMASRAVEMSIDCEENPIKPIIKEDTPETNRKSVRPKQSVVNDCHVSVPKSKETINNGHKPESRKLDSTPSCSVWSTSADQEPDKQQPVHSKSSRKNRSKKSNEASSGQKKFTKTPAQEVNTDISNRTRTRSPLLPPMVEETLYKEIKPEQQSFHDQIPSATSSPFKLRPVKEEPRTSFSIIDTVNLSDDDDDIFPSSQLFDATGNEDVIYIEDGPPEIKSENILDAYDIKEGIVESEYDEIIVPSDSDDEDNPWLQRLSESQRIKEEEPDSPPMEFFDEMKNLNLDLLDAAVLAAAEVPESREPEEKKQSSHSEESIEPLQLMSVDDIEKELNQENEDDSDSGIFHTSDPLPTSTERRTTPEKELDKSLPIKQVTPKGPKIIEPLHLPPRRRSSVKDSFTTSSKRDDTSSLPSTSTRSDLKNCSIKVSKLPTNLSSKQKRQLEIEDRVKQKQYEDEQKLRRVRNKWAQNVPLPLGKRKSLPISKNEKLEIVNQRKEKLKALADKEKMNSAKPSVERVAPQGKAKISTKNRGEFLISEQQEPAASTSKSSSRLSKTLKTKKESKKSTKVTETPSTSMTAQSQPRKSASPKKISSQTEPLESGKKKKASVNKVSAKTREEQMEDNRKSVDEVTNSIATVGIHETIGPVKEASTNQKENQVPNSMNKQQQAKIKKKVRFNMVATEIREYEIDPNNTMKKCPGKDALIPKDKLLVRPQQVVNTEPHPRLEEFLFHILAWNPSWLEEQKHLNSEPPIVVVASWLKEQKHLKTEPPIVADNGLIPLLTNYNNYKEYYHIMVPLLLLELWHGITKEFESIDQKKRRQTLFCSIVNNSITLEKIPSVNATLTTMMLEMLANEDEIKRQIHPVYGDLVFLELCYRNDDGKLHFSKVFGYVTHLHKSIITPHTFFNRDLGNYVRRPTHVLTYTVLTKSLKMNLLTARPLRLRCVTYLRSRMRMVQALQSLPKSPLLHPILNPKSGFRMNLAQPQKPLQNTLITKDKLNSKQAEAVFRTTEAIARKQPKICLIQGPPGTGKSHVIVNMVMQVLYGDNRYRSKDASLRILLCAPSNAAIDEIVLRLLRRRGKLPKEDRFKMVRVGMANAMHPRVKDISVEELAKRDLKRTNDSYQFWGQSMDSVEEEKRFIEAKINALQSELSSTQRLNETQAHCNRLKLANLKARYDVIKKCGQNESYTDPQYLLKQERDAQNNILLRANIIACTLSSCYTNIMESAFGEKQLNTSKFAPSGKKNNISVCIVDEATQSCEAETLIPLMLGVNTLVLVGDPAQLPATIISQRAKRLGLDQSLFSRIQRAQENLKNTSVIMLDTQYRMDCRISYWPNQFFYGGKLKNAEINDGRAVLPFHPYRVLNIDTKQSHDKFSNTEEAEFVANLIHSMIDLIDERKILNRISIGVITPYKNQQNLVEVQINQRITTTMENLRGRVSIEMNTVDSFQGHERDIIVMSCVRTNGIGFLSDPQRLCVALTRAKHCLVLCGNFATFRRDRMWNALLEDAQSRKNYVRIEPNARPSEIVSHLVR